MMLVMASKVEAGKQGQPRWKAVAPGVVPVGEGLAMSAMGEPGAKHEKLERRKQGREGPEDKQVWYGRPQDEDGDPDRDGENSEFAPSEVGSEEGDEPRNEPVRGGSMEVRVVRRARGGVMPSVSLS